jgi:hypothetical protein
VPPTKKEVKTLVNSRVFYCPSKISKSPTAKFDENRITGNVTDEVIMKYIEEQDKMERVKDADFKVDE